MNKHGKATIKAFCAFFIVSLIAMILSLRATAMFGASSRDGKIIGILVLCWAAVFGILRLKFKFEYLPIILAFGATLILLLVLTPCVVAVVLQDGP